MYSQWGFQSHFFMGCQGKQWLNHREQHVRQLTAQRQLDATIETSKQKSLPFWVILPFLCKSSSLVKVKDAERFSG